MRNLLSVRGSVILLVLAAAATALVTAPKTMIPYVSLTIVIWIPLCCLALEWAAHRGEGRTGERSRDRSGGEQATSIPTTES